MQVSTDEIIVSKLIQIISYLRQGTRGDNRKQKKKAANETPALAKPGLGPQVLGAINHQDIEYVIRVQLDETGGGWERE